MIEFVKLKNHKGIEELTLSELGHINVISGRNNSGKTSVLECMLLYPKKENCSIGIRITDKEIELWKELFSQAAKRYSGPDPTKSNKWFGALIEQEKGKIYFYDEQNKIVESFFKDMQNNLGKYGGNTFNFPQLFERFFNPQQNKLLSEFKPLLIPPKRKLEVKAGINFTAGSKPSGQNLINRLFYLKNQDVNSELYKCYLKIYEVFQMVTNGISMNIIPDEQNNLTVRFSEDGKLWLDANECGLGLQDVLTIISAVIDVDKTFIMIEEPENHIHPDMQRRLLQFFKTITERQFLMATHSNVFLDPTYVDKMYFVERDKVVQIFDETNRASILRDLGYSVVDNLVSDLIILTEGPSDAPVVEEICRKIGFWDSYNIKFWPLGGDIMSQIDLSTFVDNVVKNKIIALIDSDTESKKERSRFKRNCAEMDIECFQLKRYAIENYFPLEVIQSFSEFRLPEGIKEIESNVKVENQIGINLKKNLRKLARTMTIEHIQGTDLFTFCKRIEELVKQ